MLSSRGAVGERKGHREKSAVGGGGGGGDLVHWGKV